MIFGAILAGGIGSRMGENMPKQFLPLDGKPVLYYCLHKFLQIPDMDCVFIGVHADWMEYTQDIIHRYLPEHSSRVRIVQGGSGRNETLQNIIAAIDTVRQDSDADIIVTHDAARPFVTLKMLEENIAAARKFGAVNTVCPAIDTIVLSENGETVSEIPNKAVMYYGHSPQSFQINLLKKLYSTLTEEEKATLTDACKICVLRGQPVAMVKSEYTNLKITTPGDYLIAQAYVANGIHLK